MYIMASSGYHFVVEAHRGLNHSTVLRCGYTLDTTLQKTPRTSKQNKYQSVCGFENGLWNHLSGVALFFCYEYLSGFTVYEPKTMKTHFFSHDQYNNNKL